MTLTTEVLAKRAKKNEGRPRALPAPIGLDADVVACIIGHAGAGKKMLAERTADLLKDVTIVSFASTVKRRAQQYGYSIDDDTLRTVGASLVKDDVTAFVTDVLNTANSEARVVIVAGVHHVEVHRVLKALVAPTPIMFVHLKAPKRRVLDAAAEIDGRDSNPETVLSDSTERDVDRELLATAELVLDGSAALEENAMTLAESINKLRHEQVGIGRFVDGLEPDQRTQTVVAVTEEFGWLLPSEAAERLDTSESEVVKLITANRLFSLDVNGTRLIPGFAIIDGAINTTVERTLAAMRHELSPWEILMWLLADSNYADDLRPLDAGPTHIDELIRAELAE